MTTELIFQRAVPKELDTLLRAILAGKRDSLQVVLGPVVWQPHGDKRRWYFRVVSGAGHVDEISADDRDFAAETRGRLAFELMQQAPVVIHDFDDELEMAKWCAAIWPGPKFEEIVESIETERASKH